MTTKEHHFRRVKTMKERHGEDFYKLIGKKGGQAINPNKGFGSLTDEQKAEFYKKRSEKMKGKNNAN